MCNIAISSHLIAFDECYNCCLNFLSFFAVGEQKKLDDMRSLLVSMVEVKKRMSDCRLAVVIDSLSKELVEYYRKDLEVICNNINQLAMYIRTCALCVMQNHALYNIIGMSVCLSVHFFMLTCPFSL